MKRQKVWMRIALALLAAGLVVTGVAWAMGARPLDAFALLNATPVTRWFGATVNSDFAELDSACRADGVYEIDARGLSAIDLKWTSGSVEVAVSEGEALRLEERTADGSAPAADEALQYGVRDGTLYVQYSKRDALVTREKRLTLSVPGELAKGLEAFDFEGASASLTLRGICADRLSCDDVSGALTIEDFAGGEVRLRATSGGIDFSGAYDALDAQNVSGGVRIAGNGGATRVSTTSGGVTLAGDGGAIALETVSGRLEINAARCPDRLEIDSNSGDILLSLPADSAFTLDSDLGSGELNCGFEWLQSKDGRLHVNGGGAQFRVEAVSGDLTLKPAA